MATRKKKVAKKVAASSSSENEDGGNKPIQYDGFKSHLDVPKDYPAGQIFYIKDKESFAFRNHKSRIQLFRYNASVNIKRDVKMQQV